MPWDAVVMKIQRELCHPRCAWKVTGLSRNGPLVQCSRPTELWNHSDLNRSIFWAHEFPWKEWERNFCKVWLRYHLKKWSSHLLDNFSDCLICAPEKGHFFNSSFLSREHMSPTNWPAHIWVASKLCWLEYYTSIAEDTWLFSGAHETIAEIVQQVWGPFLQFISQPH